MRRSRDSGNDRVGRARLAPYGSKRIDLVIAAAIAAADLLGIAVDAAQRHVVGAARVVGLVLVAVVVASAMRWRRTRPLRVLGAVVVGIILASAIHQPPLVTQRTGVQIVVVVHAIASWSTLRRRGAIVAACMAVLAMLVAAGANDATLLTVVTLPTALVAAPWFAGANARVRRHHLAGVEAQLAAAEGDREARARRAVAIERARIARELHDVVAHHVSLIGLQAGAARSTIDASSHVTEHEASASRAFAGIEASSREVLREMRQLLDVLDDGTGTALAAPPRPEEFTTLCTGFGEVGLVVAAPDFAAVASLSPLVTLTLYRIIEEALTNVTRHSAAPSCQVELVIDARQAEVVVTDPGPARPRDATSLEGSGRGITGMRERARLFGGSFTCGATPSGGFVVRAVMPLAGDGGAS